MGSFIRQLRASSALGRAERYLRQGRDVAALDESKRGLGLLPISLAEHDDLVACSFMVLVIQAEQIAARLGLPGVSHEQLEAAVQFIRRHPSHATPAEFDVRASLPFLEERLREQDGAV